MAFSLDGTRLYSGARKDNEIICWDLRVRILRRLQLYCYRKLLFVLPFIHLTLMMLFFQVPGRPLFCVGRQCNTNQKISIDISQDGKWLVSGGTDGKVQVWNVSQNVTPTVHMEVSINIS